MTISGTKKTKNRPIISSSEQKCNSEKEPTINSLEECINLATESVKSTSGQEHLNNE
jgi:hypothetical protein